MRSYHFLILAPVGMWISYGVTGERVLIGLSILVTFIWFLVVPVTLAVCDNDPTWGP